MAIREDYYFPSADGKTTVHAVRWSPEKLSPIAVLQFIHGVGENTDKYEETAEYLVAQGFIVAGIDLLGHGKTSLNESDMGFFADRNSWKILCADIHKQYEIESSFSPALPYFLLGHSLGSFLGRTYISIYDTHFSGCLFTGSTQRSPFSYVAAYCLAAVTALFRGPRFRSSLVSRITYGRFTPHYGEDHPLLPTVGMSRDIFGGMAHMVRFSTIKRSVKDAPIFFFSGAKDPVSKYGAELYNAKKLFEKAGCSDVTVKVYPNAPHSMLRSDIKEEVWHDISIWILDKINQN